jgi:hypothetical protein
VKSLSEKQVADLLRTLDVIRTSTQSAQEKLQLFANGANIHGINGVRGMLQNNVLLLARVEAALGGDDTHGR